MIISCQLTDRFFCFGSIVRYGNSYQTLLSSTLTDTAIYWADVIVQEALKDLKDVWTWLSCSRLTAHSMHVPSNLLCVIMANLKKSSCSYHCLREAKPV